MKNNYMGLEGKTKLITQLLVIQSAYKRLYGDKWRKFLAEDKEHNDTQRLYDWSLRQ